MRLPIVGALAVVLLTVDLFSFGINFNTAADTRVLDFVPQSIAAIKANPGLYRVVTYGDDDTLPSNTNMIFGLQDVRGYDTIILREYVEYLEQIEPATGHPLQQGCQTVRSAVVVLAAAARPERQVRLDFTGGEPTGLVAALAGRRHPRLP